MKVKTELKAGSAVDAVWQLAVDTGENVVGFVKDAEYQAQNLTASAFEAVDTVWQGFTGIFR